MGFVHHIIFSRHQLVTLIIVNKRVFVFATEGGENKNGLKTEQM